MLQHPAFGYELYEFALYVVVLETNFRDFKTCSQRLTDCLRIDTQKDLDLSQAPTLLYLLLVGLDQEFFGHEGGVDKYAT